MRVVSDVIMIMIMSLYVDAKLFGMDGWVSLREKGGFFFGLDSNE